MKRPLCKVCFLIIAILAFWYFVVDPPRDSSPPLQEGEEVYLTGRVCEREADRITIDSITCFYANSNQTAESTLQTNVWNPNMKIKCNIVENELSLGEQVTLRGNYALYQKATNPGQFDAYAYYARKGVVGRLSKVVLVWKRGEKWWLRETLRQFRERISDRIHLVFPEKEAGVLDAIVLGEKNQVDQELKKTYQRNGILHILSISGLHISFLGLGLYGLLRRMGISVPVAGGISSVLLILYGIMTGGSVSAIRAIGMFLIRIGSLLCGRTYDGLTALAFTGCLTLLAAPENLSNSGFYYSYGAVLGILVFLPVLQKSFEKQAWETKGRIGLVLGSVGKRLLPGVAMYAVTLPIQLYTYYEVPVFSLLLNLIIVPTMSFLLVSGMLALVPGLGVIGLLGRGILWGYEEICRLAEGLPFHMWRTGKPALWQVICYYVLLLGWLYGRKYIATRQKQYIYHGGMFALLLLVLCLRPMKEANITFLDIGQGSCCIVQTRYGQTFLFDCGSTSEDMPGQNRLIPYLNVKGIDSIDKVFLSHADKDHMNGLEELFLMAAGEGIKIQELVLPYGYEEAKEFLEAVQAYRQKHSLKITCAFEGDVYETKGMRMECLNPERRLRYEKELSYEENQVSQCFYIELKGKKQMLWKILLTGDTEKEGEEGLIRVLGERDIRQLDVLQVGHHGSRNATSEALLEQIDGTYAVISCAKKNSYGHPNPQVVERLIEDGFMVRMTMEEGAIVLK